jgi:putative peptide zinc metalloprotease protein
MWYRVAQLQPRLRSHVRVQRQKYRNQTWYLLIDSATGRQHRINPSAYQFVGRCDGRHTVQQVWDTLLAQLGDDALTQDEVVNVLTQLAEQELLQCETTPDVEELFRRHQERTSRKRRAWLNPLAFRVPLFDPTALLERLQPLTRPLFHPLTLTIWAIWVLVAVAIALVNWPALRADATVGMYTPRYLLLGWICFPFIKALHELGHALAVKHWGAEVREAGVTLLALVPAPYVDASAATAFRHPHQRVVVSAAGIMVELALAAAALVVWANVQPGLVRDVALVTAFIGAVSTVLLNANPLMRFDGYYALTDALELPNLAVRSRAWWCWALRRYLLRDDTATHATPAAGERKWLMLYAPLSWVYRLFASALMVGWLAGHSALIGWIAALLLGISVLARPMLRLLKDLLANARSGTRWTVRAVAVGITTFALMLPVPFVTVGQGVVWLPEGARVRAETDGFIVKQMAKDGAHVEPGDILLELSDPLLLVERQRLESSVAGLQAELYQLLLLDPVRMQDLAAQISQTEAELAYVDQRIERLQVRSQASGRLVIPHQEDLTGTFVRKGATVAYVLTASEVNVRVAVAEQNAALVQHRTQGVEVRPAEQSTKSFTAALLRELPTVTKSLPSAALSNHNGGEYVTDREDKDGLRTLQPVALFDVRVPDTALARAGGRVWVRFDHGAESLAGQWYWRLSQFVLGHFNPNE